MKADTLRQLKYGILSQRAVKNLDRPDQTGYNSDLTSLNVFSSNFELQATINISLNTTAGFVFRSSSNGLEYTTLIYDPVSEYLILNRTCSSLITEFISTTIYAKHTLY